jgi:hypothetical protein
LKKFFACPARRAETRKVKSNLIGKNFVLPSPKRMDAPVNTDWNIYRTRFLVKAKQLTHPVSFIDALGREHSGQSGDYLVEWSDGSRRVAPREIFEDVYVPMGPAVEDWRDAARRQLPSLSRRPITRPPATA